MTERNGSLVSDATLVRLSLGVAVFAILGAGVGVTSYLALGIGGRMISDWMAHTSLTAVVTGVLAWLAIRHQPRSRGLWLLCGVALSAAMQALALGMVQIDLAGLGIPADLGLVVPADLPVSTALMLQVGSTIWVPQNFLWVFALLIFPDSRLPGRRWKWAGRSTVVAMVGATVAIAWTARPTSLTTVAGGAPTADVPPVEFALYSLTTALVVVFAVVTLVALVQRYRRGGAVVRQQVRWIAWAGAVLVVDTAFLYPLQFTSIGIGPYQYTSLFTISLMIAAYVIAITRYRLYEIDRIISRTATYGLVSAILAAVYVGVVLGVQWLLGGSQQNSRIIAGSTLLVAAIFHPVRRRAQNAVDRRFNRRIHDATRLVENFGQRLPSEADLESLSDSLRSTATTIVQPTVVGVWIAGDPPDSENGSEPEDR